METDTVVPSYQNNYYQYSPYQYGLYDRNYTELHQFPWHIYNENTENSHEDELHHLGTVIGNGFYTESSCGKEVNWDSSSSQPDDMDTSLEDVSKLPTDEWCHKPVQSWTSFDIMNWIIHEIKRHGKNYETTTMEAYELTGDMIYHMSREEFESRDPNYGGILYDALQSRKDTQFSYSSSPSLPSFSNLRPPEDTYTGESVITCLPPKKYPMFSDAESECSQSGTKQKRPDKPGRPTSKRTRKQEKKTGRLWEFIRDLLLNREYCPSLICWENYEQGVFRFVRSDKVAELWGTIKENPRMTYEKLSRAMRYYYKSKVLQPVLGRRLVYKFGPSATNWHTKNPNFRNPE